MREKTPTPVKHSAFIQNRRSSKSQANLCGCGLIKLQEIIKHSPQVKTNVQ